MRGPWIHLCIDMQRIFAEETPWHVPWMKEVCPQVEELAGRFPERTIFTRFITPSRSSDMPGMWRDYYEKWSQMTRERLDPQMTFSPWMGDTLHGIHSAEGVGTVVLTGGETDVCVLSAALGAIDLGYSVIVLRDAVCSGADETHDASLELLGDRFSVQLELLMTEEFLQSV